MSSAFMLRRNKGETLRITGYADPKDASVWKEEDEITWYASTGLTTHEKDDALFILYSQIDRGVDRWIQDKRYVPRLLIAAAIFLVVYFFFSLAVRDPLPMVDELVFALAGAIGASVALAKRDKKSDLAMKRRLELKQNASRADFVILEGLSAYEAYLDTCSYLDTLDLADRLAMATDQELPPLDIPQEQRGEWEREFLGLLKKDFSLSRKQFFHRFEQIMAVQRAGKADEALAARLVKLAMHQQLDLPLLAFLVTASKQR
ncbi:MAG: hypothetical protein PHR90_08810 [Sphaerochaetaceae bacterium]|nr:hypothetical protein [Sphaerochaetaceae bacterium]